MSRELLKRAAVVLREVWDNDDCYCAPSVIKLQKEIVAYLAQPEPEPVAWLSDRGTIWHDKMDAIYDSDGFVEPLYTTPTDQSARIAELTQHLKDAHAENAEFCQIIERQTKQLAALQANREPLSEIAILKIACDLMVAPCSPWLLRDDVAISDVQNAARAFARAIEAAHNIGSKYE